MSKKGQTCRPREAVAKEAMQVLKYVKAAPKSGRRYADMVKKVFDLRGGEATFGGMYDPHLDRNLLTPIMKRLKAAGVAKCTDGRYRAW